MRGNLGKFKMSFLGLVALAAGMLSGCVTSDQMSQMGSQQHPKILKSYGGTYAEKGIEHYTAQIGRSLVVNSDQMGVPYTFTILNSPVVNAFALPGGYVYVTRGILALANSEAELAGVLGHEIGHVAANHSQQRHNRSIVAGIGSLAVGVLTGNEQLTRLAQTSGQLYVMNYSRDQEYESDEIGVRYLQRSNYDPYAVGDFLSNMSAQAELHAQLSGQKYDANRVDFFSTHPNTSDRVSRAYRLAKGAQNLSPGQLPTKKNAYLSAIDGMLYGDDPSQGLIRGRRFSHAKLGFTFEVPEGYSMENSPAALVAKGPNNKMVRFDAAADYRSAPSLGQYITGTWAPSLGIQVMRVKTGMASGIPWARGFALVNTSRGGVLAHLVAYQFGPNEVYRLLSVTSSNVSAQEKAEFDDMVSSFRRLSPGEAAKLKPYRLKVVKVEKGETVYNLSKRMAFDDHRASRFRALNGLGPKDGLQAGQWVKIVVEE